MVKPIVSTFLSPTSIKLNSPHTAEALGGKAYSLINMMQAGILVPPGLVLPTQACHAYEAKGEAFMESAMAEVMGQVLAIQTHMVQPEVLFSVRSGAPISMPGMMDTILNVGITPASMPFWEEKLGKRAARDCLRRLIQMMGATAYDIPAKDFEDQLEAVKHDQRVQVDSELSADALQTLIQRYLTVFAAKTSKAFPSTLKDQLQAAIEAVFRSWHNERAKTYRAMHGISDKMGTAVTVQAMVFGNLDDNSGSGVAFTREPTTGHNAMIGEFLVNAQGEDVVSGIRTPMALSEMASKWPALHKELVQVGHKLEGIYHDMMDLEFTVQAGTLYLLQCRPGKRAALATVKIALDQFLDGEIDRDTVLKRVKRRDVKLLLRPRIADGFDVPPTFTGIGATIGVVSGVAVLSAEDAINCKEACVLIRHETNPNDIGGMAAAVGILTQHGGSTSHAAVVARSMNKACVVGCGDLPQDLSGLAGKQITLDALTGRVWVDQEVPLVGGQIEDCLVRLAENLSGFHRTPLTWIGNGNGWMGDTFRLVDYLALDPNDQQDMRNGAKEVGVVWADLRVNQESPQDPELNALFDLAAPTTPPVPPEELVHILAYLPNHARVLADDDLIADRARSAGFTVQGLPSTFKELVEQQSKQAAPSLVKLVGGQEIFDKLVAGFGPSTAQALPAIQPWQTALFAVLED